MRAWSRVAAWVASFVGMVALAPAAALAAPASAQQSHTITASAGANGTISPSGNVDVDDGADQAFTITPAANYHVADVLVDGEAVGAVTMWTFFGVDSDHTIDASFAIDTYTITASGGANGTISPTGAVGVNSGDDQSFTITPAANYHVLDVLVDGSSVGAVTTYTFTNVTAAHTIAASFAIDTRTITASAGANGSISPTGSVVVNYGSNQTFTITPNTGYHVANVLVDGSTVGAVTTYTFTNVTAAHTIAASFAINTYTITASAGANGAISPSGAVVVNFGDDPAFTITPNTGYHVLDVLVDGSSVGAVTTYTFTNVAAAHTIAASFAINTYTITASAGANGSISPSGAVVVNFGDDPAFTITPNTGCHVLDVLVDGSSVGAVTTYTFTNVAAAHTIAASFAINTYTISASAGANGSISPSGSVVVNHGSNQTFTITPSANYHVLDVLVDGGSVGAVTTYTFTNVTAAHTIAASFAIDTRTITASAGANGSISPTGSVVVNYGSNQAFTITPNANYHVLDVLVDGSSVGAVTAYTFTNVTAAHTIAASFAIDTRTITASAGANGSISPSGSVVVNYGSNQAFTITPSANYHVLDVLVDGSSVGAVTTYTFTNVTAAHTIAASFAIDTRTITASAGANGTISPNGSVVVNYGSNQAFTITPNANYHVLDVLVDGSSVGAVTTYTFTNVTAAHTIAASFAIDTRTITASAGANGSISPSGSVVVNYGSNQAFTITPNANYHVLDVLVDGSSVGAVTTYTFTNVTAAHTIAASFAIDTRTITASAGANGAISPSGSVVVNYGANQAFTITPSVNYHVLDVLVDGSSVGAVTTYTFTNVAANHTIAASFAINTYTISASAGANGSISPSGAVVVNHGSNQAFTITPNANYHVLDVLVDGSSVGAVTTYTFTNVTAAHTIAASFAIDTRTITASAGANGTISPSGSVVVNYGSNQAFTITPNANYHVLDVLVDGSSVGAVTAYTFTNVTAAHTIAASFAIDTHTITASAGANGSISPSGSVIVNHGSNQAFTITPSTGYHVADVLVDGSSAGAVTTYTFTNVTANHTIAASFAINTYTITASAGADGAISPSGAVVVNFGDDPAFTITPNTGYHVADVLVDGSSVGAVTTYTFSNVAANHTIAASFAINTYTITASAGANGAISPSGSVVVNHGANQAFTITPNANYHVLDVLVDGSTVGAVTAYTFTNVTTAHTIAASFAIDTRTITASAGANGSISPSGSVVVNYGSNQAFTITPNANFHVLDVLVDGSSVGAVTTYTFTNVTAAHTIAASFAIDTRTITASAGANGSISPTGSVVVNYGSNQTFTITPNTGYHVANVLVDGSTVGAVTTYTFTNVTAAHTIAASFAINTYTITASAGANGSISPSGAVVVNFGDDPAFTVTSNTGYHVLDVLVDGSSVGAVTTYTFNNVAANHTIAASFAINTYTISASAGANGSISPSGSVVVNHGSNQTFTITPSANYHVLDVLVDGSSVGAVTTYTFTNVTAAHTIAASFAIDTRTITASAGANGSISPSGSVVVNYGSNQTFTITPNASYHVLDVLVDGSSVGAVTTYTFTNVTANHTIAASFAINTYTITASAGANGAISPSGSVGVSSGANQTFTITPSTGYHVADVLVDGSTVGAVTTYTFTNVTANHSIAASFAINTYTITASAGVNGSISPSGSVVVNFGDDPAFTITPNTGYHVKDVLVDGSSVGAVTTYTFTNVAANHTIAASFEINTYTITASAGTNGSISPSGAVSVTHGANQSFTITPNANYHVLDVLVDGSSVGAVTTYTFTNVTTAHTIAASFAIDTRTIAASAGANGSITPSGSVVVNYGSNQTFTITPNTGYHVANVLVDGSTVGAVTTYTFTNVTANHTIAASFAINTYTITASAGANGAISPSGSVVVNHGSNQAFTITPNANYHVLDVLVDGSSVGAVTTYTFTNVTAAHTIAASFAIDTRTITASAGANGSISPTGSVVVNYGANQSFTITPNTGYHVADVLVDGGSVGAVTTYTFTNVTAAHTIAASFAINTFTIAASAGANGAISPSGSVVVNYGANQTFTMTPNTGYHVADVLVDGSTAGAVTTYTFTNVTAAHTISATFAINTYTITASAGGNGSISPSGSVLVNHGNNQTFTITPNANYHVLDVLVDGGSVGAVTTYTFTNVTAAHTIAASFAINTNTITASAGPNGTISPTGAVAVGFGANQTFTMNPQGNYHVLDVLVDGASVGPVTTYTFTNVTAPHTISVTFTNQWTITASAGANGTITPSGAVSVTIHGNQLFTITPNTGYHVLDVLVDGVSVPGAPTTYTFSNVTADHTIAASFAVNTFTITASAGANGAIAPSGSVVVNYGSNQTFTITPNTGYHVADVLVDGSTAGAVTTYTFTNVTANHTIVASFAINTYTITASAGANGAISPSGSVVVNSGANQTFTITPSANYHVLDVLVDGVSAGAVTTYTFTNVTAAHTIAASFAIDTRTITASAGANGTITPSGSVVVNYGSNQSFTITPNTGYHVANVLVDAGSVGAVTTYTFTNVTVNHTISASFAINTFTITASAGANGSIAPTGAVTVNYGANQSFTITPNANYHVLDVLVDGSSVGAVTAYTFTNVTAAHTIAASFAIDTRTITASAGANGSISPSGSVVVNYGANQAFTITPNANYHVQDVLVDGSSVGAVTTYTFTNVTVAHTIAASFAIDTRTITASAGANGSISPSGSVVVNYGANQAFTITPNTGYHVANVLVDAGSVGAVTTYTFTNVTANHTISATFALNTFTITASAGTNGTITPSGAVGVGSGQNQAFTMTPNTGYHVLDVLVDGTTVGAVTTYTFTNVTANHTISVTFAINQYTLTASAGANGTITPTGAVVVNHGSNQAFTITPSANYHVLDVLVDGSSVGAVTTYTFTNVTANHTIAASFAIDTRTITASAGANGSISPTGSVVVNYGANQAFTITPSANYHVQDVLVDGSSVGAVTTYTFTNVTAAHTIAASFAIDTRTIAASAGVNGSISPTGSVVVNYGSNQSFTITPNTGYHVLDVLVDAASVGAVTTYTFTNVTANHTIAASFAINTYTITASAGANGSISPTGSVVVNQGSNQAFTITPSANYHVANVLVDGSSVGAVTTYTFTNVTAAHTIAASFAIDTRTITASAGANGSISPTGAVVVNYGSNQSFTITPAVNYHVQDVLVDGSSVGAVTTYTFTNVTVAHTIAASFSIDTRTITASAGANGTISPNGSVVVNYGSNQAFTMTPSANYHVQDVLVDGSSVGAVTTYTFTNVTVAHTIAASFAIDTRTITASAGANGSISPTGAVVVNYGSNQSFTITPNTGYHVANVLVDASSVGAVTTYTFTNVTANHTISATFAINTYTITASAGANGSIAPTGAVVVNHGSNQSFTITPNANYHVLDVLVDGSSVGSVTAYTFTNVTAAHTIAASFTINTFTITASAGANGTIAPTGAVVVNSGSNQAFTMTPNTGYHVANVLVDAASVGAVTTYTFTNVTANHTISATFAINTFTITASAGANGTISPNGSVVVNYGSNQAFTMTPSANYHVQDVLVDGSSVGAVTAYTFTNVTANHTISATFAINTFTITASAGTNGTIAPTGAVVVNSGSNQAFTMTPSTGYHIADVLVDGGTVGAVTTYTFTNVTVNHTIAASFALNNYTLTLTTVGTGSVAKNPDQPTYPHGTNVTLTATPGFGYYFTGWSGSASGSTNPLTVSMTSNKTITATFADTTAPVVIITRPAGGETFMIGSADTIRWIAVDGSPIPSLDIEYSANNGLTWTTIVAGIGSEGKYPWTVTGPGSDSARVRITARDSLGNTGRTTGGMFKLRRPDAVRLLSFQSDSANGTTHYPVPGSQGPWVDLVDSHSGTLHNFVSNSESGWNGTGSSGSPYRLEFSGVDEYVTIPAASIPELQNPTAASVEMWFHTNNDPESGRFYYLLEWLGTGGKGMSIAVENGNVMLNLQPWIAAGDVPPDTWHHIAVCKEPGRVRLFVDGFLKYAGTNEQLGSQLSQLVIGASTANGPGQYSEFYRGGIANLVVWKGALSDSQVVVDYVRDRSRFPVTTVDVERKPLAMQLLGLTPNPAIHDLKVSFSLPDAKPAYLEVLDVTGRRVREREVGSLGPGMHRVDLTEGDMPAAGIYWIRLTRGGQAITRKATILR